MKQSIINWQTGEPKESVRYIVTLINGEISVDEYIKWKAEDCTYQEWRCYDDSHIIAWCKLSDIEPYEEEEL